MPFQADRLIESDRSRASSADRRKYERDVRGYICLACLRVSGLRLIVVMPWCRSPVTRTPLERLTPDYHVLATRRTGRERREANV